MTAQDQLPHSNQNPPDLASYGEGMGPEYEWLLSDHPWASAERLRRAADYFAEELDHDPPAPSTGPSAGSANPPHTSEEELSGIPPELAETVGGLVEPIDPTADPHQLQYTAAHTEPDEVTVARRRVEYEEYRRAHGEPSYRYPERYLGDRAADHPPPGY